ncbi:netrin receptor UNC5C [Hyalella azteca]|uniref:Netrin receptor UNC5 n=1 Tax=Hyalella azteca TaxID=294128 RepID=A0A979FLS7_HYAAZ|nr:netrin receptor UNC5C [Hyalella azteca]
MRCLPPEGQPPPSTLWLKNDKPIDFNLESNYRVSSEGSLLLLSAGLADTANFSCVAENVAAKRVSPPAALKVYVDGSWSSWSAWSECSADCGLGSQKRTRTCTAPPPGHGGASCQGSAFERSDCTSTNCPPVDGAWSAWGEWSTCGPDCTQRSSRACDAPAPLFGGRVCVGDDTVTRNCTGGMCMSTNRIYDSESTQEAREKALQQDITLIVVLAVLVPLVLVLTFFLFRKFASKSRPNGVLYEVASTEYSLPFYTDTNSKNTVKVLPPELMVNGNQSSSTTSSGGLVIDNAYSSPASVASNEQNKSVLRYEVHYTAPGETPPTGTKTPPSEHFYDVPLIRSCLESPSPSEGFHLLPTQKSLGGSSTRFSNSRKGESSPGSSLEKPRSSSPNSYISEATSGYSHPSVNSGSDGAFPAMLHSETHLHVPHGEGTVWEEFGSSGGRLIVPEYGVSLTVPQGSIPHDKKCKLYLSVLPYAHCLPMQTERQTLLSPLIWCGPPGTKLLKPAVLAFEHSASLQHAAWKLHVFAVKNTAIGSQEQDWQKIITLGEERLDTPVYTQLDGNQAFLMSDCLQPYAVVGESAASSSAVKLVRVVASAPPPAADGQLTITLHVIQNTTAHLKYLTQQERKRGACLLDKPRTLNLLDCGSNLVFSLDEVATGWKMTPRHHHQEISFESLWNSPSGGSADFPSLSFRLERSDSQMLLEGRCPPLSCRLVVQQKGCTADRQVIRINTDFPYAPVTDSPAHVGLRSASVSATLSSNGSVNVASSTSSGECGPVRLPARVRRELCRCLDPPNARGNDWRMLAARLNVDRYLNYFACKNSPTEHILDLWEARHRQASAVTDLLNVLRVMGRPDAAHVLETHTGPWI